MWQRFEDHVRLLCLLQVPNTDVRTNSASLLLDAFPLQNPDSTAEEVDLMLQKQFDLMQVRLC